MDRPAISGSRTNGLAVASLVLGIIGIFIQLFGVIPILAIVFGFMAKGRADRGGTGGRGMALTGIVLGFIGLAIFIAVIIWVGTNPTLFNGS